MNGPKVATHRRKLVTVSTRFGKKVKGRLVKVWSFIKQKIEAVRLKKVVCCDGRHVDTTCDDSEDDVPNSHSLPEQECIEAKGQVSGDMVWESCYNSTVSCQQSVQIILDIDVDGRIEQGELLLEGTVPLSDHQYFFILSVVEDFNQENSEIQIQSPSANNSPLYNGRNASPSNAMKTMPKSVISRKPLTQRQDFSSECRTPITSEHGDQDVNSLTRNANETVNVLSKGEDTITGRDTDNELSKVTADLRESLLTDNRRRRDRRVHPVKLPGYELGRQSPSANNSPLYNGRNASPSNAMETMQNSVISSKPLTHRPDFSSECRTPITSEHGDQDVNSLTRNANETVNMLSKGEDTITGRDTDNELSKVTADLRESLLTDNRTIKRYRCKAKTATEDMERKYSVLFEQYSRTIKRYRCKAKTATEDNERRYRVLSEQYSSLIDEIMQSCNQLIENDIPPLIYGGPSKDYQETASIMINIIYTKLYMDGRKRFMETSLNFYAFYGQCSRDDHGFVISCDVTQFKAEFFNSYTNCHKRAVVIPVDVLENGIQDYEDCADKWKKVKGRDIKMAVVINREFFQQALRRVRIEPNLGQQNTPLFQRHAESRGPTGTPRLSYIVMFPQDCRMFVYLPTVVGSYLHQKDQLALYPAGNPYEREHLSRTGPGSDTEAMRRMFQQAAEVQAYRDDITNRKQV